MLFNLANVNLFIFSLVVEKKGKTDVYHAYSTANGILYYSKFFDIIAGVIPVFAHMYLCAWYDDQHEISFCLFIPTIMTWFLLTHVRNKYRIMPKKYRLLPNNIIILPLFRT